MSNKEKVISLLDKLPDYKIGYILAYTQGMMAGDEVTDDLFCERMVENYLNDPDPQKHETVTIEELAKELDVVL